MTAGLRFLLAALACAPLAACSVGVAAVQQQPGSMLASTALPNRSMIFLARTDSGIVLVELGWTGARRRLERALREMGAAPADVRAVFLTHSHRDHIGGWRAVRHAPFHMSAAEVDRFLGRAAHAGPLVRLAERIWPSDRPAPGEVRVRPFTRDTLFVFGRDTLRAFVVPGHTAGSAAYLFRGVLFVGDALARPPLVGFRAEPAGFADDPAGAARSLASLWDRVAPFQVRHVCTSHAKCAPFSRRLRDKVTR